MVTLTKLLLISCSGGETADLARTIFTILKKEYSLDDQVEILHSNRREKMAKNFPKSHRHLLVGDYFPDLEVQADIGNNHLKDVVRGKHIALVEHLLTPSRKISPYSDQCVSINDHYLTVRGFLDLVSNVETLQRTLVVPYLTYVRSHSIEKYRKRGFYQFDSLRKTLQDYQRDGLNALVTIDPHSMKVVQISEELGIEFHAVNPFQSGRAINPYKLGLDGTKAADVVKKLRPFQERFARLHQKEGSQENNFYVVSVDDGTERRAENFTERAFLELPAEKAYASLVYLEKDRISYTDAASGFKQFSPINDKNIDKNGAYIIIDDMYASGGTAKNAARMFKELGAKRVEVWTSHCVTMPPQYAMANDRASIDAVVSLDTVPHNPLEIKVEFVKASADLLAAELYKTHQKLVAGR